MSGYVIWDLLLNMSNLKTIKTRLCRLQILEVVANIQKYYTVLFHARDVIFKEGYCTSCRVCVRDG